LDFDSKLVPFDRRVRAFNHILVDTMNSRNKIFNRINLVRFWAIGALALLMFSAQVTRADKTATATAFRNSWRGITPLRSGAQEVADAVGIELESAEDAPAGPFQVGDGEVSFSYITPSLAKVYRAPRSMVGKVFTIYFKPASTLSRTEIKLAPTFKRCTEELGRSYYYFVSEAGIAYQFRRKDDALEAIIYQPTRAEARRLAVNTECVF
jgi:hypothetical protein